MDDAPTLRNVIESSIGTFCADNGLGFPTGFIYCVSRIDDDGIPVLTLGAMENQNTAMSMGLVAYLKKSFDVECEQELSGYYWALSHDDEDDD